MVIGLIIIFVFVILLDYPSLVNANEKLKAIIIYSVILIIGFIMSLLQIIDKAPTSPAIIIEKIVKRII